MKRKKYNKYKAPYRGDNAYQSDRRKGEDERYSSDRRKGEDERYSSDRRKGEDERYSGAGSSHHHQEPHQPHRRQWGGPGPPNNDWTKKKQDRFRQPSRFPHHKRSTFNWQQQKQIEQARQALNILTGLNNYQTNTLYKNASFSSLGLLNKTSTAISGDAQPSESGQTRISENPKVEENGTNSVPDITAQCSSENTESRTVDNNLAVAPKESHEVNSPDLVNIKTELAADDLDQNNTEIISQINEITPAISVPYVPTSGAGTAKESVVPKLPIIPLALLLREEESDLVLEKHFEELKKQFEKTSKASLADIPAEEVQKTDEIVKKIVDPDTLSQKIVNRVMTMDRNGIKNVINYPDPKFDAALKLRARKRLREEIRKQLHHFNLNTSSGRNTGSFEPDECVDSGHIPETIMNEIRKTFGIKFLEEAGICTGKDQSGEAAEKEVLPVAIGNTVHIEQPSNANKDKETVDESEKPKTDLMTRLKNFESIKANHSKHLTKSAIKIEVVTPKPNIIQEIVSIDSSSSNNSGSSSDSDSDSSTSSASKGSLLAYHNRQKKKKALEDNVVSSFKTLILPCLTIQQRIRFEKKAATGNLGALMHIYDVCLSKINKNKFVGNYEKKTLKKNLKSSNNAEALQFLIKNIKDLFEQDKTRRRNADAEKNEASRTPKIKVQQKTSKNNQQILLSPDNEIPPTKSLNEKHSLAKRDSSSSNQREAEKVLSESKTANSALGGDGNDTFPCEGANSSSNTARSNYNEIPGRKLDSVETSKAANDVRPRSWKSPGEKKCLQPPSAETNKSAYEDSLVVSPIIERSSPLRSGFSSGSMDLNLLSLPNFDLRQAEDLRLLSLIQQNKLSEAVLNNLKEIDLKLMELHKRRMYIEEMILKLQKDKMAIDLTAMQLQNEKFLIISSSAAQSNLAAPLTSQFAQTIKTESADADSGRCNKKKKASPPSRPPFSTPFSEKLRNRKKRCQRDILLEYTANTLSNTDNDLTNIITQSSPDEISEHVDDIFQRKKRKISPRKLFQNDLVMKQEPSTSKHSLEDLDGKEEEANESREDARSALSQADSDAEDHHHSFEEIVENNSVPNGRFEGFKKPISQIQVCGDFIIAASEDGHVYKYCWSTKELLSTFAKHTEAVTQICIDSDKFVYSTSLDGYMKKTSVENLGLEMQSVNVQEPLQTVDIQWNIAFIGSRWGNVFTYNIKKNKLSDSLLCSMDSSIMALKAVKEGARKILVVSSRKGSTINLRDATSGLLLRIIEVPSDITIYSILFNANTLFCGSAKNEIFVYNFATGTRKSSFACGNGVVAMKLFRNKYIFAGCYDGFVYVLEKSTGFQIGRFPGCGKMILAMDIVGEKFITSSKDGAMQLMDIPKYILALGVV